MRQLLAFTLLIGFTGTGFADSLPVYKDPNAKIIDRVNDLVGRMTLTEKVTMVSGDDMATIPNARLGIPALKMTDGPLGIRYEHSTAFPSGISMGATFDRNLVHQMATATGQEARAHGRDMQLGPCVGLSRVPFGGRNFESMGEDPYLTSELVVSYVHALEEQKVLPSVKHFALNDQEYKRMTINSVADERTMHELHLVPFERAVQEGAGTVMASYNKVNGLYSSENPTLLTSILKQQWGFTGFVVSDWGATHSTVAAALAGLDLEMPDNSFFGGQLLAAVNAGQVPEAVVDDKVNRILGQMFRIGLFDGADTNRPDVSVINSPEHQAVALQMAQESLVLLKNAGETLPLDLRKVQKIAVIGPNAGVYAAGGGSSEVEPFYSITPFAGLTDRVGTRAQVRFAQGAMSRGTVIASQNLKPASGFGTGLYGEYFANKDLSGDPVVTRVDPTLDFWWDESGGPDPRLPVTQYSIRWTGTLQPISTGLYELQTDSDDGVRLWIDDRLLIDHWDDHGSATDRAKISLRKGKSYKIRLEYYQATGTAQLRLAWAPPATPMLRDAIELARDSDAAVIAVGFNSDTESEGIDRDTFHLPAAQIRLIEAVAKVNPRTIVVVNTGNPLALAPWMQNVGALIYAWYPGQEGGHALADVILGDYNPSGRLPVTMLKHWQDSPAYGTYPEDNGDVHYKEGIYLGYRYYDKSGVAPEFPFGYGLSYTHFHYSDLQINTLTSDATAPDVEVTATVTNKGRRAGTEVAQLYVQDLEPKIDRPVRELKGFARVDLQPGESQKVSFKLNKRSFAYYDVTIHDWTAQPGRFAVHVGASSRDLRLKGDVILTPAAGKVAVAK